MKKADIRRIYLAKKESLTESEIDFLSEKIFENFISTFELKENQKVHCFLSIPEKGEVDTSLFLKYFFEKKVRVFVPKIVKGQLIALEIHPETPLIENSWGIKEPEGIEDCGVTDYDVVVTPLLYADQSGNRVGYGKGFYDRFFSQINKEVIRVGVGFFPPDELVEDVSNFDIPLHYLVTPADVLSLGNIGSNSTK